MAERVLDKAKRRKVDEFYTRLTDIEKEANNYIDHFKGKTVLCNCDDPRVSQFFYFFYSRFSSLGLKQLIATCYKNLNPDLFTQNLDEQAVYCIYDGKDRCNDVYTDYETFIKQNEWGILKEDGDFRSHECIELLKQSDIVVTNPPFSLFREYVAQLIEYEKKFLIIGNKNAITYKEIFTLIKENKMWLGNTSMSEDMLFDIPEELAKELIKNKKEGSAYKIIDGVVKGRSPSVWFTNIDHKKRHENLILYKTYNKKEYPKYDYYDAINVNKTAEIPIDYDGTMGVPISFLDKYNPDQFEILGICNSGEENPGLRYKNTPHGRPTINGKEIYLRVLIKRK